MSIRRLVVAGTESGVGKTTITIGIMAALRRKGFTVQGFKCGPDYIDTSFHTAVTGRNSRNLDSWMLSKEVLLEVFVKAGQDADISIIEGVMGFYDGKSPLEDKGSTAEISLITKSPVLLVVDCSGMARSAAAVVKGFQQLSNSVQIAGVFANRVGSNGHYQLIKDAVEKECGVPVIGYMTKETEIELPERHLGLIPSNEYAELDNFFTKLAERMEQNVDMDKLLEIMCTESIQVELSLYKDKPSTKKITIAIAKDAAFHFYYQDNIELLEHYGAECVYFSPLKDEEVPEHADALYIGGGYPEEFAEQLSKQKNTLSSIRKAIQRGLPTLAECGGFMYLTEEIETRAGNRYPMVGIIPGKVHMQPRLAALGYRTINGNKGNYLFQSATAKGHEFHYSAFTPSKEISPAYIVNDGKGLKQEGFMQFNLVAGYTHLHFASAPELVRNWIEEALKVKTHLKEKSDFFQNKIERGESSAVHR